MNVNIKLTNVNPANEYDIKLLKKFRAYTPSFGMLGNIERNTKVPGINMHTILKNLSKNGSYHFWLFIENRNPKTNHVKYLPSTPKERRALTKAYKELRTLDVLKRVKQGEYLINPKSFIPAGDNFPDALTEWNSIP